MENVIHNDSLSIALDKALLKLSKQYGYPLPADDPVLIQIFLNREIITACFESSIKQLNAENELTKKYFRDSLTGLVRAHNEKIKTYDKIIFTCALCTGASLFIAVVGLVVLFN